MFDMGDNRIEAICRKYMRQILQNLYGNVAKIAYFGR